MADRPSARAGACGTAPTELRQTRTLPRVPLAAGGGGLTGLCLGFGLCRMIDAPAGEVAGPLAIAGGIALAIATSVVLRALRRNGASGVGRDAGAAVSTRHAIEHALAAPDCAVAHSVSTIARAGNIDHLVATPVRLWVIGTTHRRVPREELPGVLARVADNTAAVWDWAPPGTPVRGCLVLGGGVRNHSTRNQYDYGKGPVVVHTPATLARELKAESECPRELDDRVAEAVWMLRPKSGRHAGSTSPERAAFPGERPGAGSRVPELPRNGPSGVESDRGRDPALRVSDPKPSGSGGSAGRGAVSLAASRRRA